MTSLHDLRAAFYCYGPESVLLSEDLYSSGWTLLGLFSCLLVTPDGRNELLNLHIIAYATSTHTTISCHHYQFLRDSIKLSSHTLCPFWREIATKCKHVARVIFDLRRHFNFTAECTVQSLKFVHGLLNSCVYLFCLVRTSHSWCTCRCAYTCNVIAPCPYVYHALLTVA